MSVTCPTITIIGSPICYRGFKIYPPNTTPAPYPNYNPTYYTFYTAFANWQARSTESEIKQLVDDYIAYGWAVTQC